MNARERFLIYFTGVIAAALVCWIGYSLQQNMLDRQYWQGHMLLHERRYEDAAAIFLELGQFRDSAALYDDASYQLNMRRGEEALAGEHFPRAVQYFTDALKFYPESEEVAVKLEQAIGLKRKENRRIAWERARQGDWYLTNGQLTVAYKVYKEALSYDYEILPAVKPKIDRVRAAMGKGWQPAAAPPPPLPPATALKFSGKPVGIAVGRAQETALLKLNDITTREARGNYRYVKLWVAAKNGSNEDVYVNPHEFTLAPGRGQAVPHENDTYLLADYFDGADLHPGGVAAGWLLFLVSKESKYILHYRGSAGEAETTVTAR